MRLIIVIYVLGMLLFWFHGNDSEAWNVYYYGLEKLFTASGFGLLAYYTRNERIKKLALYACSICLFMFIYFIYCMFFGHNEIFAFSSFVAYSITVIFILK